MPQLVKIYKRGELLKHVHKIEINTFVFLIGRLKFNADRQNHDHSPYGLQPSEIIMKTIIDGVKLYVINSLVTFVQMNKTIPTFALNVHL